jgi:hypothetical protein
MSNTFNDLLTQYINEENTEKSCLISGEQLEDNHIILPCNHKFNYEPLYFEFKNQKEKNNINEIVVLYKNELKCPYCRCIHKYALPYNEKYEFINQVMNKKEDKINKCIAILKSGKKKGEICNRKCNVNLCYIHRNYIINNING